MPLVENYVGKDPKDQLYEGSVTAYSKPSQGGGYTLNGLDFAKLEIYTARARESADRTLRFLVAIEADLNNKKFQTEDGSLTGAGLFMDHFNLTRNMEARKKSETEVVWRLVDRPLFKFTDVECRLLYNYARTVVGMTKKGLNLPLTFRGIDKGAVDQGTAGRVKWRKNELIAPTKKNEIPKLWKDQIFIRKEMEGAGGIHLNYIALGQTPAVKVDLTILHEATHKFARTIDVDDPSCYSARDCRKMEWMLAVRNATHHERFMGINWFDVVDGKQGQSSRKYTGYESK
jgi:hypothetical protein